MKMSRSELREHVIAVARTEFGNANFPRRTLMDKVEQDIKETGRWEDADDQQSGSRGIKSKGLADIDYAISELKATKLLENPRRNVWRLSSSTEAALEERAIEGFLINGRDFCRYRSGEIMNKRKAKDEYTCQVCGFFLRTEKGYVIDCHHRDPIAKGERQTSLDDLISLCPTCHSIAHLNDNNPLSLDEIKKVRSDIQWFP